MKSRGWLCRTRIKKSPKLGRPYYVTDNKLDRDFKATRPLQKLVTDITYLNFGKTTLYLSSIMDLYNREIVAYTISDTQDTNFVLVTLNQANFTRGSILQNLQRSDYISHPD